MMICKSRPFAGVWRWRPTGMLKRSKESSSSPPVGNAGEILASFEREIVTQENILYGMALFYEGLSVLCSDSRETLASQETLFREMIRDGQETLDRARRLLEEARKDSQKVPLLTRFQFSLCEKHPTPAEMIRRARILAKTYDEVFPNRPREQPFAWEDVFRLMEAAAEKLR